MKRGDSDSDGSAGHVWAAVMDVRGTVISKAFQGLDDRAFCEHARTCVWI